MYRHPESSAEHSPFPREPSRLSLFRHYDPLAALGAAALFLASEDPFNKLPFGHWVETLKGQILRGHYFFSQRDGRIVGYVGWGLTSQRSAEDWIHARRELGFDECRAGPCVVVLAARADGEGVARHQARTLRSLLTGDHQVAYWKRQTAKGTRLFTFRPFTAGTDAARARARAVSIATIGGPGAAPSSG